jgi:small subunit ribosomal protein S6
MREYELVLVLNPDLDDTAATELVNKIKGWITDGGGELAKVDVWGRRKLAYLIRKQSEGVYYLLHINMDPKFGITLERNLRFAEPVMRFLIIAK